MCLTPNSRGPGMPEMPGIDALKRIPFSFSAIAKKEGSTNALAICDFEAALLTEHTVGVLGSETCRLECLDPSLSARCSLSPISHRNRSKDGAQLNVIICRVRNSRLLNTKVQQLLCVSWQSWPACCEEIPRLSRATAHVRMLPINSCS